MITIVVNGRKSRIDAPCSVASLLVMRGLAGKRVAVEINGEIVPKSRHAEVELVNEDRLEIVVAVGGG